MQRIVKLGFYLNSLFCHLECKRSQHQNLCYFCLNQQTKRRIAFVLVKGRIKLFMALGCGEKPVTAFKGYFTYSSLITEQSQ